MKSQQEVHEEGQLTASRHMGPWTYAVVHGCRTWSVVLWEENGMTVFENRVWRKICGPKLEEAKGWKNCIMSFIICTLTKLYVGGELKEDETGGTCGTVGQTEVQGFGRETWRKRTARNICKLPITGLDLQC